MSLECHGISDINQHGYFFNSLSSQITNNIIYQDPAWLVHCTRVMIPLTKGQTSKNRLHDVDPDAAYAFHMVLFMIQIPQLMARAARVEYQK